MGAVEGFEREQQTRAYPPVKPIVLRAHNQFPIDDFVQKNNWHEFQAEIDDIRLGQWLVKTGVIKPQELKWNLKLSGVFPLYRLQDKTGSEYSIAFGQDAILLDSLLRFRPAGDTTYLMA